MDTDPEHQSLLPPEENREIDLDVVMFRFNYLFERGDWRIAADSVESANAFGRIWRVPLGVVLTVLGVGLIKMPQFAQTARPEGFCEHCITGGISLIFSAILAAWGPIYQDLKFLLRIRRGSQVVLDLTPRGMTIARGRRRFSVEWYRIAYAIDSADGLLMESRICGPVWIPIRAFSNWEQQCEVHRFIEARGVDQRSYGSGWGEGPLDRLLHWLSEGFGEDPERRSNPLDFSLWRLFKRRDEK